MKTKKINRTSEKARIYITATFNNTMVVISDEKGQPLVAESTGMHGFKGTRKSTPYAASLAVEDVVRRLVGLGMRSADIYVKGPGAGRDSSLRGIKSAGLSITSISDITPMPHNGPRAKKKRRV